MTLTATEIESLSLSVNQEIRVNAPLDVTFEALLEQLGPGNEMSNGTSMPMKLEAWPGGRWYRDLGNDNGHLWAHVQAIKRPTLIEFAGPLFMSFGASNNVQYRLSEESGVTLIKFHHSGFGLISDEIRKGVGGGWTHINQRARERAERAQTALGSRR